jgi:hypothetical protein
VKISVADDVRASGGSVFAVRSARMLPGSERRDGAGGRFRTDGALNRDEAAEPTLAEFVRVMSAVIS